LFLLFVIVFGSNDVNPFFIHVFFFFFNFLVKQQQMEGGYSGFEHGTDDQSVNICSKTCREAYCCFAVGADNCRANNLDICAMYDVCIFSGVSSRTSQSIPVAPEEISTHCDGALIASVSFITIFDLRIPMFSILFHLSLFILHSTSFLFLGY
jgi:hypothetical protein